MIAVDSTSAVYIAAAFELAVPLEKKITTKNMQRESGRGRREGAVEVRYLPGLASVTVFEVGMLSDFPAGSIIFFLGTAWRYWLYQTRQVWLLFGREQGATT